MSKYNSGKVRSKAAHTVQVGELMEVIYEATDVVTGRSRWNYGWFVVVDIAEGRDSEHVKITTIRGTTEYGKTAPIRFKPAVGSPQMVLGGQ